MNIAGGGAGGAGGPRVYRFTVGRGLHNQSYKLQIGVPWYLGLHPLAYKAPDSNIVSNPWHM